MRIELCNEPNATYSYGCEQKSLMCKRQETADGCHLKYEIRLDRLDVVWGVTVFRQPNAVGAVNSIIGVSSKNEQVVGDG